MKRFLFLAAALAAFSFASLDAEARPRAPRAPACDPTEFFSPCAFMTAPQVERRPSAGRVWRETYQRRQTSVVDGRPSRYVAGRLKCAVNVNLALAERGIKGTGSALAKSFLSWGRPSSPVPGAVAVSSRGRRGGHVAIVSRVEGGRIYVWNPSSRGQGWKETVYRHRAISFRVDS